MSYHDGCAPPLGLYKTVPPWVDQVDFSLCQAKPGEVRTARAELARDRRQLCQQVNTRPAALEPQAGPRVSPRRARQLIILRATPS